MAVKVGAVATPLGSVLTLTLVRLPGKVPLAPEGGAVKVTETLGTGLLLPSFTMALSAVVKAVFTVALCDPPAVVVMEADVPARLVSAKLAGEPTPLTVAATL